MKNPVLEESFEKLEQNNDQVQKLIEDDRRVLSWIAWSVGIIFEDKNPDEMFSYMKDPNLKEIKSLVKVKRLDLKKISESIVFSDLLYVLYEVTHIIKNFFKKNFSNMTESEIREKTLILLCAMQFLLNKCNDKEKTKESHFKEYYNF